MTCQEFWNTMPELRGADEARHAAECALCAARMARQQELDRGLRALAANYRSVGAPARIESRLRAAFRSATGVAPVWRWAPVFASAAACVAMLALAVFLIAGRQPVLSPAVPAAVAEIRAAAAGESSEYDGFIPLPNAERLAESEEVNLVRVEVPRSAMIALGLEVSPERATELVAADVMLGPDGLARAVRFLDSGDLF